jgi:hypothetical protein
MRKPRKAAPRRATEGAKAPEVTIPALGQGRLTLEQLNTLTRDVVDYMKGNTPVQSNKGVGSGAPVSAPVSPPYKPRLESIRQALLEHLGEIQGFSSYLNPSSPTDACQATSSMPSGLSGLLDEIEQLLVANSNEFHRIRNLF